VTYWVFVV